MKFPKVVPLEVRLTLAGVVMLTAGESTMLNVCVWADATGRATRNRTIGVHILINLGRFREGNNAKLAKTLGLPWHHIRRMVSAVISVSAFIPVHRIGSKASPRPLRPAPTADQAELK
jgi:hypothetical protein